MPSSWLGAGARACGRYLARTGPNSRCTLLGERTMFQIAVERLAPLFTPERILVVTNARYADDLQRQSPELPAEQFHHGAGPARHRAGHCALGAQVLPQRDPHAVMACLTADHFIGNEAALPRSAGGGGRSWPAATSW